MSFGYGSKAAAHVDVILEFRIFWPTKFLNSWTVQPMAAAYLIKMKKLDWYTTRRYASFGPTVTTKSGNNDLAHLRFKAEGTRELLDLETLDMIAAVGAANKLDTVSV